MKTTAVFVAFLLFATTSFSQIIPETPWTWMKGDNIVDQSGVYGTNCIPHTANKPGARSISSTWRDQAGNLWLFGGMGLTTNGSGFLNDLWKFNPLSNIWTWMKGDSIHNQYSSYGVQGTGSTYNKPGGTYSGISWVDNNGDFWLFGGYGYAENAIGLLNALWKYDVSSNEWTWINGDKTIDEPAIYGVQGVTALTNKPGARYCSQSWTDQNGDLWLFGGYGIVNNTHGELNDIWKYNIASNQWTWVKGDSTLHQKGTYGTKGIPNASNNPGSRFLSISWKDHNENLWLFGGYGYDENNLGSLNDLWKYNTSSNQWTWVSGDKTIDQVAFYGSPGVPSANNKPGSRYISSSWKDVGGDLWVYGGYGYDATNNGYLNDLWKYNIASNQWTWVKGDSTIDQVGIYGTQGMPDSMNKSGSRNGSVSWSDGNGNLWLFGGYGFDGAATGALNDLWKINSFGVILPVHLLQFSGVLNNETARLQWKTEKEEHFSHFNIQRSFDGIHFVVIGTVMGAGNNRNDYSYADIGVGNLLQQRIFYRLQLVNKNAGYTYSKILRFDLDHVTTRIGLFPNPAVNSLTLSFIQRKEELVMISISDMMGKTVLKQTENIAAGHASIGIDVSTLSSGGYILSVTSGEGMISSRKFIKH